MVLLLRIVVSIFVLNLAVACNVPTDFLRKYGTTLPIMCPGVSICGMDENNDGGIWFQCCNGCSCKADCHLYNACCFGRHYGAPDTSKDPLEQCTFPVVGLPRRQLTSMRFRSFYMISSGRQINNADHSTTDASTMQTQNTTQTKLPVCECEDKTLSGLDNMFPVFAESDGNVYINRKCAECHGAQLLTQWAPEISCDIESNMDINQIILSVRSGRIPSNCYIEYIFPDLFGLMTVKECFNYMLVNRCPDDESFTLMGDSNITRNEIIEGCHSGLSAHFPGNNGVIYSNIFCAICNNVSDDYLLICLAIDQQVGDNIFTSILSSNVLDASLHTTKTLSNMPLACADGEQETCRALLCPVGQLRSTKGDCEYVVQSVQTQKNSYLMYVRLIPATSLTLSELDGHIAHGINSSNIVSLFEMPLRDKWVVDFISFESEAREDSTEIIKFFTVGIKLTLPTVAHVLKDVIDQSRQFVESNWLIHVNSGQIVLQPTFYEHRYIDIKEDEGNFIATPYDTRYTLDILDSYGELEGISEEFVNQTVVYFTKPHHPIQAGVTYVTKLNFCDQVILSADEYVVLSNFLGLYINRTARFLFTAQFTSDPITICADDSGLTIESSDANSISERLHNVFVFTFLFVRWGI